MKILVAAALVAACLGAPAFAQDKEAGIGVGVTGGTLGVGPEVNFRSDNFGARASATFFSYGRNVESDDIEYDGDLKLRSFGGSVDFYPGGGGFRISGGARISNNRVTLEATPTASVEVGDVIYTPAQIGVLSGEVKANKLAPTLTIGYGGGRDAGIYFGLDAGVMFQGAPKVRNLRRSSTTVVAGIDAEIAREAAEIEDDVDNFKIYPILQLGLGFRF